MDTILVSACSYLCTDKRRFEVKGDLSGSKGDLHLLQEVTYSLPSSLID